MSIATSAPVSVWEAAHEVDADRQRVTQEGARFSGYGAPYGRLR